MPGDTVDVPVPAQGDSVTMDPTISKVIDQGFANTHDAAQSARERRRDAADNIAEQTRLLFLEEKFKIGQREASAQQRLDSDKLAFAILQQRSAKDQPDKAPG